jgi:hypothetical protein
MVKLSASQPRDYGFEPLSGHYHDTSTGWFQEVDLNLSDLHKLQEPVSQSSFNNYV